MRRRSINLGWGQYWLGWASLQRGHHLSTGPFSLAQDTRDKCSVCKQRRICVYRITDSLFGIYKSWKHGAPRCSCGSSYRSNGTFSIRLKYSLFLRDVVLTDCAVSHDFLRIFSANAFVRSSWGLHLVLFRFLFREKSMKRSVYITYIRSLHVFLDIIL